MKSSSSEVKWLEILIITSLELGLELPTFIGVEANNKQVRLESINQLLQT